MKFKPFISVSPSFGLGLRILAGHWARGIALELGPLTLFAGWLRPGTTSKAFMHDLLRVSAERLKRMQMPDDERLRDGIERAFGEDYGSV